MRPRTYTSEQNRSLDELTGLIDAAQADRQAHFNRGFYLGSMVGVAISGALAVVLWGLL